MEEYLQMIKDCLSEKRRDSLTDWEARFLLDIERQLVRNTHPMTFKQQNRISEIWEKVTKNG